MDAKLAAKRAQRALDAENERLHQERLEAVARAEAEAQRQRDLEEELARLRADSEYEEDVGLMELDEPAPEAPGGVHACA